MCFRFCQIALQIFEYYLLTVGNQKERHLLKVSTDWFFFAKKVANPLFWASLFKDAQYKILSFLKGFC